MSTKLVRAQIAEFLRTHKPEVMCIRGNWGTGKTYSWDDVLKKSAAEEGGIACNKYAYVSLFGKNSVEDVKREIVNQTIAHDRIGKEFNPDDLSAIYQDGLSVAKKGAGLLSGIFGDSYYGAAMSVMSLLIRDRLVCIDDLERKGEQLRSADILGLISQLKEERKCKIVLLLNDEQLEDREEFEGYLEKVVDINLRFAPSAPESAEIALAGVEGSDDLKKLVRESSIKLGIDNVRVIRKILRLVLLIEPLLKRYKPEVLKSVVGSLSLFGWCHYQPELAPSLEFLKGRGKYDGILEKKQQNPVEEGWSRLLREYGFTHTDDFDVVLLQGVQDGYFKQESVDAHAAELNQRVATGEARAELSAAWDKFHSSFGIAREDVLDRFYECFMRNVDYYGLGETIALVDLFRELNDASRASELFDRFAEAHKASQGAFDTSSLYHFGREVPDDLQERIAVLQKGEPLDLSVDELLLELEAEGFHSEVANKLAATPVDEYVRVLTSYEGPQLQSIRRGLTADLNINNPGEVAIQIMDRAGKALLKIAEQSPLNRRQAGSWGLIQRLERAAALSKVDTEVEAEPGKAEIRKAKRPRSNAAERAAKPAANE